MSVPFVAFTVYAALTQLPEELVEASEIDGAGPVSAASATSCCPTIRPVLLVVGLLQIIWDLRVFSQIYILQKAGGSTRDTNLLGTYIYRLGIGGGEFGMAAAVAIFMLAPHRRADRALRPRHAPTGEEGTDEPAAPAPPCGSPPTSLGVLAFLVLVFPVYWMVNSSFLARNEIRSPTRPGCPSAATSTTTARVFQHRPVPRRAPGQPDGHRC